MTGSSFLLEYTNIYPPGPWGQWCELTNTASHVVSVHATAVIMVKILLITIRWRPPARVQQAPGGRGVPEKALGLWGQGTPGFWPTHNTLSGITAVS